MLPPAPARLSTSTVWPQIFGQPLRDEPRHDIGRTAGRERHDDPDRTDGVSLGRMPSCAVTSATANENHFEQMCMIISGRAPRP